MKYMNYKIQYLLTTTVSFIWIIYFVLEEPRLECSERHVYNFLQTFKKFENLNRSDVYKAPEKAFLRINHLKTYVQTPENIIFFL